VRALPYAVLVGLAGSLGPSLWLPAAVVCGAAFTYFELRCRGRWRHPAGWGVAAALLIPTVELVARSRSELLVLPAGIAIALIGAGSLAGRRSGGRRRRHSLGVAALYLALCLGLLSILRGPLRIPPPDDDLLAALVPPPAAPGIDAAGRSAAVMWVEQTLDRWARGDGGCTAADPNLPSPTYREAHVSLWLDDERMIRGRSGSGRLGEDLCQATLAALEGAADPGRWAAGLERVRIQLDLSGPAAAVRRRPARVALAALLRVGTGQVERGADVGGRLADLVYEIEPGIDGIEMQLDGDRGLTLPADPVLRGWLTPRVWGRAEKVERLLIHAARDMRRGPGTWREPEARILRFRTASFGRPVPGGQVVPLVRGNVAVEVADADELLGGAGRAAEWLVAAVAVDGTLDYERFPNTRSGSDEYNAVRHAGCVVGLYRMARLAARTPDAGLLPPDVYADAGWRAENWSLARLHEPEAAPDPRLRAVVFGRRGATAGAAAFAILAILERPPGVSTGPAADSLDNGRLEGLGRFVQAMIDPDGRVFETWDDARASERVTGIAHPYFPGLVVLSLAELYGSTGDQRWLDAAREVADFELDRYRTERPPPGHWTIQGYWELYRLTGDERYARANLELGDHFVAEQYPPHDPPFPDYRGAFHRGDDVPRTIRAASRCEALGAVVDSARALGEDATVYEDALLAAGRHLLENQYRPENRYYLPASERVVGAVRLGLVDNHCRVDGNKHAMLGLVQAWRVARRRAGGAELTPWPETPQRDGP
jgi:hypothetical protein